MSIVYQGHNGVGFDIYVMPASGGTATPLVQDPKWEVDPMWSPDGSRIAFRSNNAGNYELYVMPAGGGEATRLTNSEGDVVSFKWLPDGSALIYSLTEGDSDLWSVRVDALLDEKAKHSTKPDEVVGAVSVSESAPAESWWHPPWLCGQAGRRRKPYALRA